MSWDAIHSAFAQDAYLAAPDHIERLAETQLGNHIHCHQRPPLEDIDTARTLRFLNDSTNSEADQIRHDWLQSAQRALGEIRAKQAASLRVELWIARRENALKAASCGIEAGLGEWCSHTMDLANGVAIGDVDISWTQPDDGPWPMKRLLTGHSTGAKGSTHRISGAENGHTGRACHVRFSDVRADQSSSKSADPGSTREVPQRLCMSSASTIMFSPCL